METTRQLAALLRDRGAEDIDHPGGTLFAHLERVQGLAAACGLAVDVQLAARAHAVHGTDGFDVRLLATDERPLLSGLIGPAAELLVHRYGVCDRKLTWHELASTHQVHDRHTGTAELLGDDEVRDFADLSLVNEIDVAGHAPGVLEQYGGYFRRLTELWSPVLSPTVLAEARRVFA